MKRAFCGVLCLLLATLALGGCRKNFASASLDAIRYDIAEPVKNLDPQFATGVTERLVLGNLCEGLLTRDAKGELTGGAAEEYEISPDGKTLTFHLRSGAEWSGGNRVTATDFVFAFRRMFAPAMPSPFAREYAAILNAAEILNGAAPVESLGVLARNDTELEIRLASESPYFPGNLAETPALPCNEDFFTASRGRYGLEKQFVNTNGPYRLEKWEPESLLSLSPNPNYKGGAQAGLSVSLYIAGSAEKLRRFSGGDTDLAELTAEEATPFLDAGYAAFPLEKKVWCVVFNTDSELWGNPLLRQALSLTTDRAGLKGRLPGQYSVTEYIVPPASMLAHKPYRQCVNTTPVSFDPVQGKRLLEMGIASTPFDGAVSDTILVPENPLAVKILQQGWQKNLAAYISVEAAPLDEVYKKFLAKDYGMAFIPISPLLPEAASVFSIFTEGTGQNLFEYLTPSPFYETAVSQMLSAPALDEAAVAAARAESLLLSDALVIPIFTEKTMLVMSPALKGVAPAAFPSQLRFQYAAG